MKKFYLAEIDGELLFNTFSEVKKAATINALEHVYEEDPFVFEDYSPVDCAEMGIYELADKLSLVVKEYSLKEVRQLINNQQLTRNNDTNNFVSAIANFIE